MESERVDLDELIRHFETALASRSEVGQAMGILMERFDLSADQAFALLRRLSSTQNVKLRTLAASIVRTREVPLSGSDDVPT